MRKTIKRTQVRPQDFKQALASLALASADFYETYENEMEELHDLPRSLGLLLDAAFNELQPQCPVALIKACAPGCAEYWTKHPRSTFA